MMLLCKAFEPFTISYGFFLKILLNTNHFIAKQATYAAGKTLKYSVAKIFKKTFRHIQMHRSIYIPARKEAKPKYDPTGIENQHFCDSYE